MADKNCSVCEEYIAEWYCERCDRKICQECDEVIHLIPEKMSHQRVPIAGQHTHANGGAPQYGQPAQMQPQFAATPNRAGVPSGYAAQSPYVDLQDEVRYGQFRGQLDATLQSQQHDMGYAGAGDPYGYGPAQVAAGLADDNRSMTDFFQSGQTPDYYQDAAKVPQVSPDPPPTRSSPSVHTIPLHYEDPQPTFPPMAMLR
jgi:hypothetical protein